MLAPAIGEHRMKSTRVRGIGLPVNEAAILQPTNQPGQASGGQHDGARQISHPQLASGGVVEGYEDVELLDANAVALVEPLVHLPQNSA